MMRPEHWRADRVIAQQEAIQTINVRVPLRHRGLLNVQDWDAEPAGWGEKEYGRAGWHGIGSSGTRRSEMGWGKMK